MVLPRERVNLLKNKFLNMRQIIHGELGEQEEMAKKIGNGVVPKSLKAQVPEIIAQ